MHHLKSCETTLIVNGAGFKLRNSYGASSTSNASGKLLPLGNAKELKPLSGRVYSTLFEVELEEHRSESPITTQVHSTFSGTIDCIGSGFYTIYIWWNQATYIYVSLVTPLGTTVEMRNMKKELKYNQEAHKGRVYSSY